MQTGTAALSDLLAQLRKAGENPPRTLFDAIVAHGQEAIQPLIALATDDLLYLLQDDVPDVWTPYHAIRLLGELRVVEAVGPLMTLLEKDDDYVDRYLPESLASIGRPAVEPLRAALLDPRTDVYGVARGANALVLLAEQEPALRDEIVGILVDRLNDDNPRDDLDALRAFLVSDLAGLRAVEAKPTIQRLYDGDLLDATIIDYETYQTIMDRPEGTTPHEAMTPLIEKAMPADQPVDIGAGLLRLLEMTGGGADETPVEQPVATRPQAVSGRKVGRNERCPCGSGKKFKRCCGR